MSDRSKCAKQLGAPRDFVPRENSYTRVIPEPDSHSSPKPLSICKDVSFENMVRISNRLCVRKQPGEQWRRAFGFMARLILACSRGSVTVWILHYCGDVPEVFLILRTSSYYIITITNHFVENVHTFKLPVLLKSCSWTNI